jgi:hypothetical protein
VSCRLWWFRLDVSGHAGFRYVVNGFRWAEWSYSILNGYITFTVCSSLMKRSYWSKNNSARFGRIPGFTVLLAFIWRQSPRFCGVVLSFIFFCLFFSFRIISYANSNRELALFCFGLVQVGARVAWDSKSELGCILLRSLGATGASWYGGFGAGQVWPEDIIRL